MWVSNLLDTHKSQAVLKDVFLSKFQGQNTGRNPGIWKIPFKIQEKCRLLAFSLKRFPHLFYFGCCSPINVRYLFLAHIKTWNKAYFNLHGFNVKLVFKNVSFFLSLLAGKHLYGLCTIWYKWPAAMSGYHLYLIGIYSGQTL